MLEKLLKFVHPEWIKIFNEPTSTDATLIDLLEIAVKEVIATGVKSCPDSADKILKAFNVDPNDVKCLVMGQDPYMQPGISTGYAFANLGDKWQPSLQIIVRELEKEYQLSDLAQRFDGSLQHWVNQGILLLNASLSCEQWKPNSHKEIWKPFMTELINKLNYLKVTRESMSSLVFVMLGKEAQSFTPIIQKEWHYIIYRYHPAVETHGDLKFTGFYQEVNKYLAESGQELINWVE